VARQSRDRRQQRNLLTGPFDEIAALKNLLRKRSAEQVGIVLVTQALVAGGAGAERS
jgi:hypothetical protein